MLAISVRSIWSYSNGKIRSLHEVHVRQIVGHVPLAKAVITFGAFGSCSVDNILVNMSAAKLCAAHRLHVQQSHHPCDEVRRIREVAHLAELSLMHAQRIAGKPKHKLTELEQALRHDFSDGVLRQQLAMAREERRRVKPPSGALLSAVIG